MGGVVFSTAWGGSYKQVIEWHKLRPFSYVPPAQSNRPFASSFNGGDAFCLKACDPSGPRQAAMCQHIYDTQGCGFNAPSNARNGVFESCAGDSQNPPGSGVAVPASSLCSTFASSDIYGGTVVVPLPGATGAATTRSKSATATPTSAAASGGSAGSNASKTASVAAATKTSGAGRLVVQGLGVFGAVFTLMMTL